MEHLLRRAVHARHTVPPRVRAGAHRQGQPAHVGIRGSLYDRQDLLDDKELGFTIVHCRDIDRIGVDGIVERVVERVGDHPVYVSIDIDVLDPAFAPRQGPPRPAA